MWENMKNIQVYFLQKISSLSSILVDETSLSSVSTLIQRHVSQKLVDFDNHLDNLTADWTNSHLNEIIDKEYQTWYN